jgi:glycosyltransferase involved in cell wall biosynthesis
MYKTITLNDNYSTTRRVIKADQEIISDLVKKSKNPEDKFDTMMFLPEGEGRQGEGGLRTKGYFKVGGIFNENKINSATTSNHISANNDIDQNDQSLMPLITVVTVVYNGEKFLEETILSVINQTYDNVEYIIIDGGSTDRTIEIIGKYENYIDYWVSEKDEGIYDAMNKGLGLATGGWINFMNADDFLYSNSVLGLVSQSILKATAKNVVVYGSLNLINSKDTIVAIISNEWQLAKRGLKSKLTIPHQSAFTSRKRILEVGPFNTKYKISGDYDLSLRVLNGRSALFLDNLVVASMRIDGVSSDPNNSINVLSEYRQAQKDIGLLYPSFSWMLSYIKFQVRRALLNILGEKLTFKALDHGNRLLGRNTFWSNR